VGQREYSRVLGGKLELALRTEHALRADSPNGRRLKRRLILDLRNAVSRLPFAGARQARANQRKRHDHSGTNIRRTAHDAEAAFGSGIHLAEAQAIGVRMASGLNHFRHDHALEGGRDRLDILDHEAGRAQPVGDLARWRIDFDEFLKPAQRKLHCPPPLTEGNCARNRRSFSKKSRMSSIPSFIRAVRSTPMPNANPWYSAGSSFTARSTFGWIIPQPSTSVHPLCLHTGHPAPEQSRQ